MTCKKLAHVTYVSIIGHRDLLLTTCTLCNIYYWPVLKLCTVTSINGYCFVITTYVFPLSCYNDIDFKNLQSNNFTMASWYMNTVGMYINVIFEVVSCYVIICC